LVTIFRKNRDISGGNRHILEWEQGIGGGLKRLMSAAAILGVVAGLAVMTAPAVASPVFNNMTYAYRSAPGNVVGNGCSVAAGQGTLHSPLAQLVGGHGHALFIGFTQTSVKCGTVKWTFELVAPPGKQLVVGAHSFTTSSSTTGWFFLVHGVHACATGAHGTVTVKRLHTDHRVLDLFGADIVFDYWCNNSTAGIHGEVAFGS
jgi:hypothetical protein